jgi:hypothetical protein
MDHIGAHLAPDREHSTASPSLADRVHRVRSRLPGQVMWERIETARALYGPLYSLGELQERLGDTLPAKLGYRRTAICEPLETYRGGRIPDEALLKYDDAARTGLFSRFWVASPAYREERQADPWILGELSEVDRYAVIVRWD